MIDKIQCLRCSAAILWETFEDCEGLCMPCFKDLHRDRMPHQLEGIRERGDEEIEEQWQAFQQMIPPMNRDVDEVAGIRLGSVDSQACGCIDRYLVFGELDDRRLRVLQSSRQSLADALPHLSVEEAYYYETLRCLVEGVLEKVE